MKDYLDWEEETIEKIKQEALRILERINAYEKREKNFGNRNVSAIKRATLDFNREAVALRKGWTSYVRNLEEK